MSTKAYRDAHREEACVKQRAYYAAHREEELAKDAIYRAAHKEQRKAALTEYKRKNKDVLRTKRRAYLAGRKEEQREYQASYHEAHRAEQRNRQLIKRHGISAAEFDALLASQGGVCAVCGEAGGMRRPAVDHSHITGDIRGILCSNCNTAIGLLADLPERADAAALYLRAASDRQSGHQSHNY